MEVPIKFSKVQGTINKETTFPITEDNFSL